MPSDPFRWPTDAEPVVSLQADCLTVLRKLPDDCIDAVITDPPYGMSYSSGHRQDDKPGFDGIANDERPFVWWLFDAFRVMREGSPLVCFCRFDVQEAFRLAIEWAGFRLISQLVWDRGIHGMGDLTGCPGPRHDVMWLAAKGKYKLPGTRPVSVYPFKRVDGDKMVHPTEKPVPLMRKLIADYTKPGDLLFEPFGGSGATGVAAYHEGRQCVMTELSPDFVAAQRKRLASLKGEGVLIPASRKAAPAPQPGLI